MSYVAVLEQPASPNAEVYMFDVAFPFGVWRVTASEKGLRALNWLDAKSDNQPVSAQAELPAKIEGWKRQLENYLAGEPTAIDQIPVDWAALPGTTFQKNCWLALLTIPRGETRTYGWIAEQAGSPTAFRAAGQANGSNPIPLVIPCHRVIGTNGKLTGFMRGREGGLDIKTWLLALEKGQAVL